MKGDILVKVVAAVTKKWAKTRKAEIRESSSRHRRAQRLYCHRNYTYVKEAVIEKMEEAIQQASGGGRVEFPARIPARVIKRGRKFEPKPSGDYTDDLVGKLIDRLDDKFEEAIDAALRGAISKNETDAE